MLGVGENVGEDIAGVAEDVVGVWLAIKTAWDILPGSLSESREDRFGVM